MEIKCDGCGSIFRINKWPSDDRQYCESCYALIDNVYIIEDSILEGWIQDRAAKINEESLELPPEWFQQGPLVKVFRIVVAIIATPLTLLGLLFSCLPFFAIIAPDGMSAWRSGFFEVWKWAFCGHPQKQKIISFALRAMKSSNDAENELIIKAICQELSKIKLTEMLNLKPEFQVSHKLKKLRSLSDVSTEYLETLEDVTFALLWARQVCKTYWDDGDTERFRQKALIELASDRDSLLEFAKLMVKLSPHNVRIHPFLEDLAKLVENKAPEFAAILKTPKNELLSSGCFGD